MSTDPQALSHQGTLSRRAAELAGRLAGWQRRRVTLAELWRLFDEADPASRAAVGRRALLAGDLAELAAAGRLTLPASAASFDRSERPALPNFVTLPSAGVTVGGTVAPVRQRVVWHPALSWIPGARLTPSQRDLLERVNRWLHASGGGGGRVIVPVRERSWEIFGDEKTIDRLEGTSLFADGRVSLELLRCRRAVPGFVWQRVGSGDWLLVVENSDTFDSVARVLSGLADHPVGLVGWGAGAAFEASVRSIARLPVAQVRYFGDLDEAGLRIPASADATARREGLPAVRPARGLYEALLRLGRPQPGQRRVPKGDAATLTAWLDERHRQQATELLSSGQRMAQEAVGYQYLLRDPTWRADLATPP